MEKIPTLREVDLTLGNGHHHPHILVDGKTLYLVRYAGNWYIGRFNLEWYGLRFSNIYPSGCQFDTPGTNSSRWERCFLFLP